MKANLEFEAARQQKLLQFQELPVSVPEVRSAVMHVRQKLRSAAEDGQQNDCEGDCPFFSVRFLCSYSLIAHSRCTYVTDAGNEDRWYFANLTRHGSQPRNHHRKTCRHTTSRVLALPRMTEVYPHTSSKQSSQHIRSVYWRQ
jgi:hypothetical protein